GGGPRRDEQRGRPRRRAARARRRDGLSDRPTRTTRVSLAVIAGLERSRTVVVLLLAALVLFTARIGDLSLASLEDAFYAREAVRMARSAPAYTLTLHRLPTHQHPPPHP